VRAGAPKRLWLAALCLAFTLLFAGLGVWQVERLQWKLDLIRKVDARLAAAPTNLSDLGEWSSLDPKALEYTRVRAMGQFDFDHETKVDALTELGAGWWVLTPLHTDGGVVFVNRGFIPKEAKAEDRPAGQVSVTGLLRPTEPAGRVLRANRPAEDRWYSRDVAAIAERRGLGPVAPFFIDADAASSPGSPRGGLTVVHFRNAHLVYALTWFGLALLSLGGLVLVVRQDRRG